MLDRLEKKFGKYAIKNLIVYIIAGYIIGYLLYFTNDKFGLYNYIILSPQLVMRGQVWRLFTWVLTIPTSSTIWAIIALLFFYTIGKGLESTLGSFKYNVFIFSGWFFMTFGAMIFYWISLSVNPIAAAIQSLSISTYYINMASFLAFAVLYPDVRVLLFFIIPIRMKILAIIDAIYLGYCIISNLAMILVAANDSYYELFTLYYGNAFSKDILLAIGISGVFSIVISLLNFLIFFIATRKSVNKNKRRKKEFQRNFTNFDATRDRETSKNQSNQYNPQFKGEILHRCEICGKTNVDYPNLQFRYCSKCSGNHEYCEEHIFTHEHIK